MMINSRGQLTRGYPKVCGQTKGNKRKAEIKILNLFNMQAHSEAYAAQSVGKLFPQYLQLFSVILLSLTLSLIQQFCSRRL